jgi:hypothetical protein
VEASQARISQFAWKLEEARRWVVHVAPSRRLRWVQAEDGRVDAMGCIEPFYLGFAVFYVLGPRDNLIF